MSVVKTEYLKRIKQLRKMERYIFLSTQGSYPLHVMVVRCGSVFITFAACVAIVIFLDALGHTLPAPPHLFSFVMMSFVAAAATAFLQRKTSWEDVLLKQVTAYRPLSHIGYRETRYSMRSICLLNW
jgi:hypothetical protein